MAQFLQVNQQRVCCYRALVIGEWNEFFVLTSEFFKCRFSRSTTGREEGGCRESAEKGERKA